MKKKVLSGLLALALVVTSGASMIPAYTAEAEELGTTYYVSSIDGDDSNDGLSEDKAFATLDKINEITLQPGDEVLLEKGSVFEDQALHIKGSGSEEAPIIVSTYGEGDRPQINTNGHGQWYQNYGGHLDNTNHKWKGTVSSSILLMDVEYIEISGLEITNDRASATDTEKDKEYNDAFAMDRTGVAGVAKDKGTVDHIVLDDLYIHDVTGNVYNKHMANGGIYFIVETPENESETGVARYNDVQIRNCYLDTVNRWGIAVGYTYQWGQFKTAALSDDTMEKYGSSNVVIENNYVANSGGDAITTMYLDRPVVQYNVSQNAAKQINTTDYSKQQPQLDPTTGEWTGNYLAVGNQRVAAGIWPWKCKDAVFQYNECFNTMNASNGNGDGQPWDADYGDGTNYQYNYSHGNTASTVMFCGVESINNTFRYNISQNEDMGPLDPAGNTGNCHVYNNTFYIKEGLTSIWSTMHSNNGPMTIENNIFYFAGDTPVAATNWNPSGNKVYDNNLYYNVSTYPNDENAVKVDAGTPVLVDAGSGPVQAAEDGKARLHDDPNEETVFDGYKLAENSPALNAGKVITDQNGFELEHDFFGHELTAVPEIGAAESDLVSLAVRSNVYRVNASALEISALPKNTTAAELKENLIYDSAVTLIVTDSEGNELDDADIVAGGMKVVLTYGEDSLTYTIVENTDNELKSSVFMVSDKTIYVPSTENNPATVEELKDGVEVHETASVSVWNGEEEVADGAVAEGMTLRITAENGTANDYTIAVKNDYQWAKDYVHGQQGNVWFAQAKIDGEWQNMTEVDSSGWPNWQLDTYYGPGVDAPQGTTSGYGDDVHGLISTPIKTTTAEATAMAFRAPKTGMVNFSIKDDEPYLRQAGNSGGSVIITLLVNGEEVQSCKLTDSNVKGDFPDVNNIWVEKGDWILVQASNEGQPSKGSVHITPEITYVDAEFSEENPLVFPSTTDETVSFEAEYATELINSNDGESDPNWPMAIASANWASGGRFVNCLAKNDYIKYAYRADVAGTYEVTMTYRSGSSTNKVQLMSEPEGVIVSDAQAVKNASQQTDTLTFNITVTKAGAGTLVVTAPDTGKGPQIDKFEIRLVETAPEVDKSGLQAAYDEAAEMDLSIYTDESKAAMEAAIAAAEEVLADADADQDAVDSALAALNSAKDQLVVKSADKSELEEVLAAADEYAAKISNYTPETAEVFETAYDAAKEVFADAAASQEDVDSAAAELQAAIDGLKLAGDISTAVLEYALELSETVDTEGVVESVVNIFNERKAAAQDILARVQDGDQSVTQAMVDQSWMDLIEIMQYMSFKSGDMTDLQKVVDYAKTLDLSKYLDDGQQAFKDALAAGEAVLEEEFAEQDEIDQAWKALLKAMGELRLKPSKDALEALITDANELNTEGASEEVVAAFNSALTMALSVLEDDQATEEEVSAAETGLKAAMDQLTASTGSADETPSEPSAPDSSAGGNTGSSDNGSADSGSGQQIAAADKTSRQNSGNSGNKTTAAASGSKAVKTGDCVLPIAGSAAAMMLAAAAAVLAKRKRS